MVGFGIEDAGLAVEFVVELPADNRRMVFEMRGHFPGNDGAEFAVFGAVIVVVSITSFMVYDNKKRDRKQGIKLTYADVPTSDLREGPANPSFRWMY